MQSNAAVVPRSDPALLAERKRLSRELHDAVGQPLNSVLMQIRLASVRGTAGAEDLRLLEITTQQALDQARALAYGLRVVEPDPLEDARRLAEHLLGEQRCMLVWLDDRTNLDVAAEVEREISAAIKESATNIARHAHADRATIRLESPERNLRVTIEDNGVGFQPESVRLSPDGRGLGLLGMAERLEDLGGSVIVISCPATGTTVILEVDRSSGESGDWPIPEAVIAG